MRPKNRYPGSAAARPSRAAGPGLTLPHQPPAQATRPPPPVPSGRRSRSLFCLRRAPSTQWEGICELLRDNAAPRTPASPGTKRSTGMLPAQSISAQGNPPPRPHSRGPRHPPRTRELCKERPQAENKFAAGLPAAALAQELPQSRCCLCPRPPKVSGSPSQSPRGDGAGRGREAPALDDGRSTLTPCEQNVGSTAASLQEGLNGQGVRQQPGRRLRALGNLCPAPPEATEPGAARPGAPCAGGEGRSPPAWGRSPELLQNR